jgi:hypothetical protein
MKVLVLTVFILSRCCFGATIAIIDTGFDLDHEYLRLKILANEANEQTITFDGLDFFDNAHLKKPVIEDKSSLKEILLFRTLRAKGHKQGLTLEEFEWFNRKSADKDFMEKARLFKKHSHGTFVAGIALREGENINIFPIRGLGPSNQVVAIKDTSIGESSPIHGKNPEEKFLEEIKQSINRVSKKFSKICRFIARKKIEIVNASYGITYKNIFSKFRERYREMVGKEIEDTKLKILVDDYFRELYARGDKTVKKYPQILFIFSAGNSGLDNDVFHHYPSRLKSENTITVAAMNGDYLATFSNYGLKNVDIGAPGVGILSIVPKVYNDGENYLYSPASGTSMAAPYVSNLAAQIKNHNPLLLPAQIKKIILETGDIKEHLKLRLASGAIVDNQKALRATLLSKDLILDQAIILGASGLVPIEDKISIGGGPPTAFLEEIQKKVMDSIPSVISPQEVDDEIIEIIPTKSTFSSPKDPKIVPPDNLVLPVLTPLDAQKKSVDLNPSNQSAEQSLKLSGETPASSSPPQPRLPETQSPESVPSSPQL